MAAATLGNCIDNGTLLRFTCEACLHSSVLDPRELAAIYGRDAEIPVLAKRARCTQKGCGAKECTIQTDNPNAPFSGGYGRAWQ